MEYQEQTIILKNPDGTIQIATQPHIKGKKFVLCCKCKATLVYEGSPQFVKCSACQTPNQIPLGNNQRPQQRRIECNECGARSDMINIDGAYISICRQCGNLIGLG